MPIRGSELIAACCLLLLAGCGDGDDDGHTRPMGPDEEPLWQDPVPAVTYGRIDDADVAALSGKVVDSVCPSPQLVSTAWASASTYPDTDKRGGANGARIRLSPQAEWDVNVTSGVSQVLATLEGVQQEFNGSQIGRKMVSPADLILLGGCAAVEPRRSRPATTCRPRSRRGAPMPRRNTLTSRPSPYSSRPPTGSAPISRRAMSSPRRSICWSTRRSG
jgi:hypothetical protein